VTTWADAHARAAALAAELHADLEIDRDRPVDVFDAIERLGVLLAFAPLGNQSGLYLPGEGSPGILIHDGHPRTRQRYTAGHELGHHAFGHAAEVDGDLEAGLRRGDSERWPGPEKEAEAFGAWFLMPRRLIRRGLAQLGLEQPRSPVDVYVLSLWLGTSYTATARHLGTAKFVESALADGWVKIAPADLKRRLAGPYVPDDLHNDVWWLDRHQHGQSIDVRPGDRIVLALDEIPSSGYSWRFDNLPEDVRLVADSYDTEWEPDLGSSAGADATPATLDDEIAGRSHLRSIVLEVDPAAGREVERLALVSEQAWEPDSACDEFLLKLSINPRLHGLQLPETALALA
jgi:hypothetical protein